MRIMAVLTALAVVASAQADVFRVFADQSVERAYPLNGVNAGPGHLEPGVKASADGFRDQYQEMGIPVVRMHDYHGHACDLSTIFPGFWEADPDLGANYDFAECDDVVEEIAAAGCTAMFRFGQDYKNQSHDTGIRYIPPPKHDEAARVCSKIAGHYGGADGPTIQLWEVWNEPNLKHFWCPRDTSVDYERHFLGLYAAVAKRLKQDYPGIVVGGPGTAGSTDDDLVDYTRKFLRAAKKLGAPVDFYSWHSYNRNHDGPYAFARQAEKVREVMYAEGYGKSMNILGEWNACNIRYANNEKWKRYVWTMDGAAFAASAMVYLHQFSNVRYAFRYRGDFLTHDHGYGLVKENGDITKPGYAYKAYAGLFPEDGRAMYRTGVSNHGRGGKAVMGVTDSGRTRVNVLVSMWECSEDSVLKVTGLPGEWVGPMVAYYRVSKANDWEEIKREQVSGLGTSYELDLPAPSGGSGSVVHLVQLWDALKVQPAVPLGNS